MVVLAALLAAKAPAAALGLAGGVAVYVVCERRWRAMHACPIRGCPSRVTMDKLLCNYHWRFVPGKLKLQVYAAWNGGECHSDHAARCAEATAAVQRKMDALHK